MKTFNKILAALLLTLIMLFNVVSCSLIPGGEGQGQSDNTFYINSVSSITLKVGEVRSLNIVRGADLDGNVVWTSSDGCVSVNDGKVAALATGQAVVTATLDGKNDTVTVTVVEAGAQPNTGNNGNNTDTEIEVTPGKDIIIPNEDDPITSDPYINVDKSEFYENYTPAISYNDAYYRTKHNLMSGSIAEQDQAPTISSYQPTSDGKYIRNSDYIFSEDGNTYYVVDAYGEIVMEIYRGVAYVVLEEVAAYVFAFGEPPANHSASKKTKPTASAWGIYLRVNNTVFSGSTSKYPYEPALPRISGCGGDLTYYEMDIGTTGTDCDPDYPVTDYNNGYSIERGAARIVYSAKDRNGNKIIDLDERYVFYTYNHYNDFQEYLNYYGGWGEMFGNITGGGVISSKYNCNPTPYVEVARASLTGAQVITVIYYYVPKSAFAA
ncbi:MAG: hypothetical protein J6V80_02165 [Clostridia bacterium]|nr:hypothetical protein [Clostridia bacterium]